jgi:alpha-galactosidase
VRGGRSRAAALGLLALATVTCGRRPASSIVQVIPGRVVVVRTATAEFTLDKHGCVRARLLAGKHGLSLDDVDRPEDCAAGAAVDGGAVLPFRLDLTRARVSELDETSPAGPGRKLDAVGRLSPDGSPLEVRLSIEAHDAWPGAVTTTWIVTNSGRAPVSLDRLLLGRRRLSAAATGTRPSDLWSFHGSSEHVGQEEVVRAVPGFSRRNALGVSGPRGLGGGIPVVAFWSASVGTALGHLSPVPVGASLPVEVDGDGRTHVGVALEPGVRLDPGDRYEAPSLFHAVFAGDYYDALRSYARLTATGGMTPQTTSPGSYEASWCSWGYGEDVTPARMLSVLPKLRSLGIRWATLDDGWFDAFGDWGPRPQAFSTESIRRVVDAYHAEGLRLQIWWVPLAVETGRALPRGTTQREAEVWRHHPDWLVLDAQGRPAHGTRGLSFLCPAVPGVRRQQLALVRRFIGEWGFDGHKLDAVFSVPRCYNPTHHHRSPDDSLTAFASLYEGILAETRALKPEAVVQICSCGTPPHHAWLPFLTQAVVADPWGSRQRRRRIKMFKGLLGPRAAVSGDHAELTERRSEAGDDAARGRDFASTVGLGGVPSSRFVWPLAPPGSEDVLLTTGKERLYRRWLDVYRETRLSEGTFRNLYLEGLDTPEGYSVEKDGRMYYAFFTDDPDEPFEGTLELRGLADRRYAVEAYVDGTPMGTVEGPTARLTARFRGHLLLVARPEDM